MNKTIFFDGKQFAKKRRTDLIKKVKALKAKGVAPKLVSIVVGNEQGALKYQELKQQKGKEVGIEVEIAKFEADVSADTLALYIEKLNNVTSVTGLMIQLPLPKNLKDKTLDLINQIAINKDVDGMRANSVFVAPVVLAVEAALKHAVMGIKDDKRREDLQLLVVGADGFVGKKVVEKLLALNFTNVTGVDKDEKDLKEELLNADVIISTTGKENLITKDMVKEGVILIDVGAPKAEIAESAHNLAKFVTPVPGGIGPVTIHFLLANLTSTN